MLLCFSFATWLRLSSMKLASVILPLLISYKRSFPFPQLFWFNFKIIVSLLTCLHWSLLTLSSFQWLLLLPVHHCVPQSTHTLDLMLSPIPHSSNSVYHAHFLGPFLLSFNTWANSCFVLFSISIHTFNLAIYFVLKWHLYLCIWLQWIMLSLI